LLIIRLMEPTTCFLSKDVEGVFSFINAYEFGPARLLIMSACVLVAFYVLYFCATTW
jgi:hypothetical protein